MVAPKTTRNSPVSAAPRFAIKELAFNNLYEIARRRWKTLVLFQVLMISHHDPAVFQRYADKVYSFMPTKDGAVRVELVTDEPVTSD